MENGVGTFDPRGPRMKGTCNGNASLAISGGGSGSRLLAGDEISRTHSVYRRKHRSRLSGSIHQNYWIAVAGVPPIYHNAGGTP